MSLLNLDIDHFLRHHWQQRPLLLRRAFPDFANPLLPDELAGLSLEDSVESRLIVTKGKQYQLRHGPFTEADFAALGDKNWTLLVQAVDHYVPAVAALLEDFRFIPGWRIDDVMVSYATRGGSTGPHLDNYDVFLIQGAGRRRWRVGPYYPASRDGDAAILQPHKQLRLLRDMPVEQEYLLEAGDVLYLPPRWGHWGIADDNDCMTYSVGFRAPSHSEMLSAYCDHVLESLDGSLRYGDAGLAQQANSGEIGAAALAQVRDILTKHLLDEHAMRDWFGRFVTTPKYDEQCSEAGDAAPDSDSLLITLTALPDEPIRRAADARFALIEAGESVELFVNGQQWSCSGRAAELARLLAGQSLIRAGDLLSYTDDGRAIDLLAALWQQGLLYPAVDDAFGGDIDDDTEEPIDED